MSKEMEVKRRANGQFKESGNPKTQFKKGDTPNPNGRNGALADIINKVFDEEVDEKTKKELMIRKVYRMAMNGSLGAVTYLSDRTEGKAKETKEITHKDTLIIE
tara:strand:- start:1249 stop:1560 length:312 start_codon:yes stop_codon:yes gene_type:complete